MHNKEWTALPASIALAGFFIGGGLYLGLSQFGGIGPVTKAVAANPGTVTSPVISPLANATVKVAPVTTQDHIRGNSNAKAVFIEYSDLECPFCKQFHATVKAVTSKFSKSDVAWVYRHYPLDALHSKARKEAEATECAAELGGNDGFWKYIDRLFEITPANNRLEASELPNIAEYTGLNRAAFEKCLSSGKYAAKVEAQFQSGVAAGAKGTPYSIIVTAKGNTVVGGAVPADKLESQLTEALAR
jgi:protein-disulfide isomerase